MKKYLFATNINDLKLDDTKKIGYVYKCLGAGFWALKQNNFRKALQKITMEVRALFGESHFVYLYMWVCVCVCVCLCVRVCYNYITISCKSPTCYTDIILVSRSSRPEVFCQIGILKFRKIFRKTPLSELPF